MKAAKQNLLNQLITALAPHLMLPLDQPLPKSISKTLDLLASQLLREQSRRVVATTSRAARPASVSDQLVRLLDMEMQESESPEASQQPMLEEFESPEAPSPLTVSEPESPESLVAAPSVPAGQKARRPRLQRAPQLLPS